MFVWLSVPHSGNPSIGMIRLVPEQRIIGSWRATSCYKNLNSPHEESLPHAPSSILASQGVQMAKRQTIGENPLDTLASDPSERSWEEKILPSAQPTEYQSSAQADLLSRVQAMEKQTVLMKWLIY